MRGVDFIFQKYKDFTEKIRLYYVLLFCVLLLNLAFDTAILSAAFHPDIFISTIAIALFIVGPAIGSCYVLRPWARDRFKSSKKHYFTVVEQLLLDAVPSCLIAAVGSFVAYLWFNKFDAYEISLFFILLAAVCFSLLSASRLVSISITVIDVIINDIDIGIKAPDKGVQYFTAAFCVINSLYVAAMPIVSAVRIVPLLDFG